MRQGKSVQQTSASVGHRYALHQMYRAYDIDPRNINKTVGWEPLPVTENNAGDNT